MDDSSRERSWGSRNLIFFLDSLGRDITNRISEDDVATIITNYIRENPSTAKKRKKKKTVVACDERLRLLFERREISLVKLHDLVAKHYVENQDGSDEMGETIDAIASENMEVLYLRKSLVQELAKAPETFVSKVVGSFMRIKDPCQLVQVTGVKEGNQLLQVTNYSYCLEDVTSSVLSDDDFSQEECEELHQRIIKSGFVKRFTVVDTEEKVRSLYEDVTKHSRLFHEAPEVVAEELEPECVNDDGKLENDCIEPNSKASFEACQSDKEQQQPSDSPVSSIQEDGENHQTLTASTGDITHNKDTISEEVEMVVLRNKPQPNPIEIIHLTDDDDDDEANEDKNNNGDDQHCDPTKVLWFYELPKGQTQGPFSITDLKRWNDHEYFAEIPDFKVWMRGESSESAVSLTKLLSYISKT
ncbi:SWIB/MDM2 [Hirschfeldia incana]|nr:SWIB/MDM2 [Hirschfeldia incana]